ncbi:hypothetical protein [Streptomyces sp. NPDC096012]|uniref:8-oxoguanine DNA glycosylase OGG fold protein n=1 Tax=Streptomyces sp. NPDC096012 TaxID=3155684 RepID=UPI00336A687B
MTGESAVGMVDRPCVYPPVPAIPVWVIRSRALHARAGKYGQRYGDLPRGRQELRHNRGPPPGLRHLAPHPPTRNAQVSRAQVTSILANTAARETLREALVATYVWGKGKSASPGGSGPATLHKLLAADDLLDEALDDAVTVLSRHGAVASYEGLRGRIPGLGPSFFTKFLYFAGKTIKPANGPAPLVLDRVLARRMRSLASQVGRETGHDPGGSIAAWVWRDHDWSPHRYQVYLSFLHAAAHQAASTDGWPSDASPDLLEYALFNAAW